MKPKRMFSEEQKRFIFALYKHGATDEAVAEAFGMPLKTFTDALRYNDLTATIRTYKEDLDAQVEKALFKSACGYTTIEKQAEKKGGVIVSQKLIEKEVAPNVTAIMMWLINRTRMTKKWQNIFAKALNGGDESGTVNVVQIFAGLHEVTKEMNGDNLTKLIAAVETLAEKQAAMPKAKKAEAIDAQTIERSDEDPGAGTSGED